MNDQILVGLDFGTTKICAIVARKNIHGKIDILGIGKAESRGAVERGAVINIEKTIKAIRNAVDAARAQSSVDIQSVYVGIAGEHIRSFTRTGIITLPTKDHEITQNDVDRLHAEMNKIALPAGDQILHVIPQEYSVDNHHNVADPVGMSGIRLEGVFHIVTGQVASAQNILRCVQRAGLHAESLILEPIASSASVLSDEEKEAGTLLIDIGGGTTDVAFYKENVIRYTSVIPFGGNVITEDIRQGCNIMLNQAEVLKVRFGSALSIDIKGNEVVTIPGLQGRAPKEVSRKMLSDIIQSRMEEIILYIMKDLKDQDIHKNNIVGGVVLTGGGSMLQNIRQLFEYTTGMDCRLGTPSQYLAGGLSEEAGNPIYSTAIGLILEGFKIEAESSAEVEENNQDTNKEGDKKPKKQSRAWISEIFNRAKEAINDFKNTTIE